MSGENKMMAEAQSAEAVNATAVAAEAVEKARAAQMTDVVESAIAKFFDRGVQEKKFIDVGRIPFICDDIKGIHNTLKRFDEDRVTQTDFLLLKQQSDLTNKIVLGAIAIILIAFLGGVTLLVFK